MSLRGFRARIKSFVLGKSKEGAPVIQGEYGVTSESARLQAAINMRLDAEVKYRVEMHLAKRLGSVAAGIAEAKRRFPEAYVEREK